MWTVRSLAVCVLIALSSLSCGTKQDHRDTRTTVVFWHSFVASTIPSLESLLKEFESTHPGIHIQAQYIPTGDGLIQKLVASVHGGTAPDISWIHSDFLGALVDAGAVVPMSRFAGGPDSLDPGTMEDIFPALLAAGERGGTLYALPMEATSLALLYNRKLFREAGLDPDHPPATWQELKDYTSKLTLDRDHDGRTDVYGFFVPVFPSSGDLNIWMNLQWTPFLWQAGGTESEHGAMIFNSEAGVRALTFWKDLYETEQFSTFGIAHDLGFVSGKLAMILDGPWNLPRYRAARELDWAVAPLPSGPAGRATYLAGELLAIFEQSRHQTEAWTFMKWILRPEVQAKFSMSSGYLPVRQSVLDLKEYREFLATDPAMAAFVNQMRYGRGRIVAEHHRVQINRLMAEAIEKATLGKQDPRMCLDAAAAKANAFLRDGSR
jgi:multiple sugar transport system substrate-binding protein